MFFYQQILQYLSKLNQKAIRWPQENAFKLCKLCNVSKIQLKTCVECVYGLINQLICITNNECLILHDKAFRADNSSRSTKIDAPSAARILVLREF